ncbi:MAG: M60 family metallopeptidase [Dysgonamonadaceae bacterium]
MKLKTNIFFSIITLCCIFLSDCSEKNEEPAFFNVEDKINLTSYAGQTQIEISTNVPDWQATVTPTAKNWLSAQSDVKMLTISVSENQEMETRKGEIKIYAGDLTISVFVEQFGLAPAILLSEKNLTLPVDGGTKTLTITSNIEYEIVIDKEDSWITNFTEIPATRADTVIKQYQFEVDWNYLDTKRQGEIIFKQKNGTYENKAIITQDAQKGYTATTDNDIKDDIKVSIKSGLASSFQKNEEIEKSFDGQMSTLYHSLWDNSAANYFPITLEYFFENQGGIDYFIYYPRTSGINGNFKETEIWVSTASSPNYIKVMDYDFKGSQSATKVTFGKTIENPKSIKFIVKSGVGDQQGFASCAEMEFYRINQENYNPLQIFTDPSCTDLKSGITLQEIKEVPNNLYRNIALYMLNGTYPREFRIQEYKAWPHPDDWSKTNKTSYPLSLLDNPTGISVADGEELVVFVGNTNGHTLSLKIQNLDMPGGDGYNNASSFYSLTTGVNKLKARNKGLAYVLYHTPDYRTALPVKIHFATGKVNGYFDSKKHKSTDWETLVNAAEDKYFDVVGEHAHLTYPTYDFTRNTRFNGGELIATYDDLVSMAMDFIGLNKYNRPSGNRAYFHVMYTPGVFYATSYRTAYFEDNMESLMKVAEVKKNCWGLAHELGHTLQTVPGFKWHGMTEVTNNVLSLYIQTEWGNRSRLETDEVSSFNNRYEKAFYDSFVLNTPYPGESDVFCKVVSLWQLQLYFAYAKEYTDFYKDYYETVRISPDLSDPGSQQLKFVETVCDITKTDLTDYFKKWGYLSAFDKDIDDYGVKRVRITQSMIDQTIANIKAKHYPPLTEKMEYICDLNQDSYKNRLAIKPGTVAVVGKLIDFINWENAVAFEVYEGDKLVYVANKPSFNVKNAITSNTKVYAIAYDGTKIEVKL